METPIKNGWFGGFSHYFWVDTHINPYVMGFMTIPNPVNNTWELNDPQDPYHLQALFQVHLVGTSTKLDSTRLARCLRPHEIRDWGWDPWEFFSWNFPSLKTFPENGWLEYNCCPCWDGGLLCLFFRGASFVLGDCKDHVCFNDDMEKILVADGKTLCRIWRKKTVRFGRPTWMMQKPQDLGQKKSKRKTTTGHRLGW